MYVCMYVCACVPLCVCLMSVCCPSFFQRTAYRTLLSPFHHVGCGSKCLYPLGCLFGLGKVEFLFVCFIVVIFKGNLLERKL